MCFFCMHGFARFVSFDWVRQGLVVGVGWRFSQMVGWFGSGGGGGGGGRHSEGVYSSSPPTAALVVLLLTLPCFFFSSFFVPLRFVCVAGAGHTHQGGVGLDLPRLGAAYAGDRSSHSPPPPPPFPAAHGPNSCYLALAKVILPTAVIRTTAR